MADSSSRAASPLSTETPGGDREESNSTVHLRSLLAQAETLKRVPRSGWLLAGSATAESVAEHSFVVVFLSLHMAHIINQDWKAEHLESPLDIGQVLELATIHDLAESILTDLPASATAVIGAQAKHRAEAEIVRRLYPSDSSLATLAGRWQEYDDATLPEARLVKDADRLEMVAQALVYRRQGQQNLAQFWQGHEWHFNLSAHLYHSMLSEEE